MPFRCVVSGERDSSPHARGADEWKPLSTHCSSFFSNTDRWSSSMAHSRSKPPFPLRCSYSSPPPSSRRRCSPIDECADALPGAIASCWEPYEHWHSRWWRSRCCAPRSPSARPCRNATSSAFSSTIREACSSPTTRVWPARRWSGSCSRATADLRGSSPTGSCCGIFARRAPPEESPVSRSWRSTAGVRTWRRRSTERVRSSARSRWQGWCW